MSDFKPIFVSKENLDNVPIVNGQFIAIKNSDEIYYDTEGTRHMISRSNGTPSGGDDEFSKINDSAITILDSLSNIVTHINQILTENDQNTIDSPSDIFTILDKFVKFYHIQIDSIYQNCGAPVQIEKVYAYKDGSSNFKTNDISQFPESIRNLIMEPYQISDWQNPTEFIYNYGIRIPAIYISQIPDDLRESFISTLDFSKFKYFNSSYIGTELENVPIITGLNPVMMFETFLGCTFTDISNIEQYTNLQYLTRCFSNCMNLQTVNITLPNCITMNHTFEQCQQLNTVTLNVNKCCQFIRCFNYCASLNTITINSNAEDVILLSCFEQCSNLSSVTLNLSKVTTYRYCFNYCNNLTTITTPLDFSYITDSNGVDQMFGYSGIAALENIAFVPNTLAWSINLKDCTNLTDDSLNSIVAGLANASSQQYLYIPSSLISKLSSTQVSEMLSKNWDTR